MYCNTWSIAACLTFPKDVSMIMPGETAKITVILRKSMVVKEGYRFTIREKNMTTVTGLIIKTLPLTTLRIKGFNYIPQRSSRIEGNSRLTMKKRCK